MYCAFLVQLFCLLFLDFLLLTLLRISQAIEGWRVTWAFCASCLSPHAFRG